MFSKLNIIKECRAMRWALWQCPPFLFLILGLVTIVSMVTTYFFASRYTIEPEMAALIVIFITTLFLVIGNLIIAGFNKIAEANRMKSEFISVISHQLRSPLSIFKWTLDVVDREVNSLSKTGTVSGPETRSSSLASIKSFLDTLRDTTEGMIKLVNTLLDLSRVETNTLSLKKDTLSLRELTENVLKFFRKYAEASRITLSLDTYPDLPPIVTDGERLSMVINNLIDNAVRYTPGSGKVKITIQKDNSLLKWIIQDEGMGIPPADQKHIFEKFFRADNTKDNRFHGSGVGLYIVKALINAMGGEVGFSSTEGKGSTFWFTLPIK